MDNLLDSSNSWLRWNMYLLNDLFILLVENSTPLIDLYTKLKKY